MKYSVCILMMKSESKSPTQHFFLFNTRKLIIVTYNIHPSEKYNTTELGLKIVPGHLINFDECGRGWVPKW